MLHYTHNGRWQGKGLPVLLGCLLLFVALRCEAQGNLVPNPSMEENSACPIVWGFQEFSKPLHWEKWNNSPDYFHTCAGSLGGPDTLIGIPQNGFGYQEAFHGEAYIGMFAWNSGNTEFREYPGCQLVEPLIIGEAYFLSFWTNVAGGTSYGGSDFHTRHACNNIGMLFTIESNIWAGSTGPAFPVREYAHLSSNEVLDDVENWIQVSGWFLADSAYNYLVLGNFFGNALTTTVDLAPDLPTNSTGAYYYVDKVCVALQPEHCDLANAVVPLDVPRFQLHPIPASDQIYIRSSEFLEAQWKVYDMTGRWIGTGDFKNEGTTIQVDQWPDGQYLLVISNGEYTSRSKFIVMR